MSPAAAAASLLLLLALPRGSEQGPHEKKLLNRLLGAYNTLERPVANESEPLEVKFGLTLQQIIDVDEKNQILTTNAWLNMEWVDYNLRWNESEYGGVKDLRITPNKIWRPDILMYNSADEGFDGTYHTNVVVRHDGGCLYVPPGIFKSTCKIDITWFPFDDQRCEMKFGSWTYDGFQLDLQLQDDSGGDISSFITNGEWDLLGMPGEKNVKEYACCPEPYVDITFVVHIRRRTLFYTVNLIVPCVMISSMTLLGFTLPHECGEKLTLDVTVLLSLTFFLNMVAETMPPTSERPLIGTYFNCIMFMVASSVVSTILILNYHHRNADTHEMSPWIKTIFLHWLPCVLRMSRPGMEAEAAAGGARNKTLQLRELELKERSSKSLLANVLDIDDDFRHHAAATLAANSAPAPTGGGYLPRAATAATLEDAPCSSAQRELQAILRELQFITGRMRKADEEAELISDWKFAAMVVDRFCLIIFTLFTIIATVAVLLSAPHIIVQ